MTQVTTEVVSAGPVLARLKTRGVTEGIEVVNFVTLYADQDRVDFDFRIHKPVGSREERVTTVFPVANPKARSRSRTSRRKMAGGY